MPRQRAAAILPPPHQLQRLQEWLRARLLAESLMPRAPDRKQRLKRRLTSIEGTARKLVDLLGDELGQVLLDELYRRGSDMRARLLEELAIEADRLRAVATESRDELPQAEAARLFLYLLHLNGSRLPAMTGSSDLGQASAAVECFHRVLCAAGVPGRTDDAPQLEAARQLLSRQLHDFDRWAVPDLVVSWVRAEQVSAGSRS